MSDHTRPMGVPANPARGYCSEIVESIGGEEFGADGRAPSTGVVVVCGTDRACSKCRTEKRGGAS